MYVLAHALATSLVLRLNSLMLGTTDVHVRSETLLRKSLTAQLLKEPNFGTKTGS